jgi:D-amino-acid dehydrogenase
VVGLCLALELTQRGADVTVVERAELGSATSRANTGWVVPALSAPISAPGSLIEGLRLMSSPDRPFYIKPRPSPDLARWLLRFARSAAADQFRAGTDAILALNRRTLELYDQLASDGVVFEMHSGGLLFLCLSDAGLSATERRFASLGYPGEVTRLSREAARELEPAIAKSIAGALHIIPERFVRPESLIRGVADRLAELGAELIQGVAVTGIRRVGQEWRLEGGGREIVCDRVVLSAGIWTKELARPLGLRLPLQPGKGYSLTSVGNGQPPNRALFFVEAMIGAAPYNDAVRLAGMLELAGADMSIQPRRVAALREAARRYLHGWEPADPSFEWTGLRPMTPDGLPVIGEIPGQTGAFIATGHGMVGVTLAPATAALLAPVVLDGTTSPELYPFRVDRF